MNTIQQRCSHETTQQRLAHAMRAAEAASALFATIRRLTEGDTEVNRLATLGQSLTADYEPDDEICHSEEAEIVGDAH